MNLSKLEKRIIGISYKKGLSHISSCLTAVNLIDHIYNVKKKDEIFILDNGHAGLALYCVIEKYEEVDAEKIFEHHGVHPDGCSECHIFCSSGSLGQGLPIALGMALSDRKKNVYVLTSDGAMNEGSNWEALRIAGEQRLENLRITVNANGTSAYDKINPDLLDARIQMFYPSLVIQTNMFKYPDYLQGVQGHYKILNEREYKELYGS